MWRIYHYTLCPFSRKVRLALAEKGVSFELAEEYPWQGRDGFLEMNPAGQTPVVVWKDNECVLCDSNAIIEYFEETVRESPVLGSGPLERAEVRRVVAWFDQKFFAEVGVILLQERMYNRLIAGQAPNTHLLRQAHQAIEHHLDYIEYLLDHRRWLGGATFSLADMTAAAHISVVDYLGGIDWKTHDQAKQWYSAIKSRPSFRPFLAERMPNLVPPSYYEKLDF